MATQDPPAAQPDEALEATIRAARSGAATPEQLFAALAPARLLLAGAPNDEGVLLPHVLSVDGRNYAAIFTSAQTSKRLPDAPGFAEMTGRDLGENWPDGLGALINPGTDDISLVLEPPAPQMMAHPERAGELSGARPSRDKVLKAGETVSVEPVPQPAPELVDAVRESVRAALGVETAYLFQAVDATGSVRLVVGAVLTPNAYKEPAVRAFVNAVVGRHQPAEDADFVVLETQLLAAVAEVCDALR